MASMEEKQETIDALKGPRFYRISITGYGGESAYMEISKEAHDFWKEVTDQQGDYDLVQYMTNEDGEYEFEDIEEVPEEAQFLHDKDDDNYKRPWYESHTEFEHTYGATYDSAWITVEEVSSGDYTSDVVREVISREEISSLNDTLGEDTDWAFELVEMGTCDEGPDGYVAQLYSSEKGCFFDGIIETTGEFNIKKLKIYTTEYLNGEDTINEVEYDGKSVDNNGGDTNGKGYYGSVWKN